jgi:chemotaxis family two-component system response regulator PixG
MTLDIFANQLDKIHADRLSGQMFLSDGNTPLAELYFYSGRLVHTASSHHRVRRLYRALQRHSQNPQPIVREYFIGLDNDPLWDFNAVTKAVKMGRLNKDNAKNVIQNLVQEVFYNITSSRKKIVPRWQEGNFISQPIALLMPEQALQIAQTSRQKWQEAGLSHVENMIPNFSLDMTAVIKDVDRLQAMVAADVMEKEYQETLVMLVNGQNTIWDLSIFMRKSLVAVMRSLLPLVIDGIVEFREVEDLPAPVKIKQSSTVAKTPSKGLVACIDDSAQIGKELEQILSSAGYETLYIADPLQGMSELLKRKPDLIFLDLIMPNTNGYEFCTFLRKTSQFKQVPIVILTGNDGVIDRVRAKLVGASDFMGKPPELEKVLQMLEKHLNKSEQ